MSTPATDTRQAYVLQAGEHNRVWSAMCIYAIDSIRHRPVVLG